ncbi:UPF0602 protein C4orf47 homolog isoform X3 [Vombatus ursinus]|uniref:UPF0602 protein C4orf47 homolog isoform X3 n=2 Tax=Vombatus ursinus TaxID=29139 RepID=UPI000FFD1208|nr:UPF0602 protein C4orf47 homolog isoform X3 [Vombatus ursinus]
MCHHIIMWIRQLLWNNRWPSSILQCPSKTQREIYCSWKEFVHKSRKERDWIWKENKDHHRLIKGTPFKLNLFPKDYFDSNPYSFDKTLPPLKKLEQPKAIVRPFKPPSPPKKAGGMKAGTFDPFPPYTNDQYGKKIGDKNFAKPERIFHPSSGPKTRPVSSIMSANVKKSLNSKNYLTASVQSY